MISFVATVVKISSAIYSGARLLIVYCGAAITKISLVATRAKIYFAAKTVPMSMDARVRVSLLSDC